MASIRGFPDEQGGQGNQFPVRPGSDIGMNAAANSDAELARKAFRLAADVCGSCGPRECVYLALAVQLSGLSAEDCAEILSPFLPKFGI